MAKILTLPSFLKFLLVISLIAFGADFFHMAYHLAGDRTLWKIAGVPGKFFIKAMLLFVPAVLLIKQKSWLRWLAILVFFIMPVGNVLASASACQHARELLDKSGTARDASEGFFGKIKTQPPYGTFPADMDQITWWGKFKPFEFWENPEFQAVWINPEGQEVLRHKFHGEACALAKTSIYGDALSRGQFQDGMWNVIVTCENYLIDKQTFAVLPAPGSAHDSDTAAQPKESAMIWAKDQVKSG